MNWLLTRSALLLSVLALAARGEVTVSNLSAAQRSGTKLVDLAYDVASTQTNLVTVSLVVSNGAASVGATSLSGAVGPGIPTGAGKAIVWDAGADWSGNVAALNYTLIADDGVVPLTAGDYLVVDLSGGTSAPNYAVSYLAAVPDGGWTDEYKTTKLVLRRIPATAPSFTMGAPAGELGRHSNEAQHTVTLTGDFYIGVFEVTQRQWELVMGNRPSYYTNEAYYATRPVEMVTYYEVRENPANLDDPAVSWPTNSAVNALSFMGKMRTKTGLATFDLPTESQWEYACRAGVTTALNSGYNLTNTGSDPRMDITGRYLYNGGTAGTSHPECAPSAGSPSVGSYPPNQWGLYDMHGSAWEWCLDWFGTYPGTVSNPNGASTGSARVMRGGSWYDHAYYCRAAMRGSIAPESRNFNAGFRILLPASQL